MDALNERGNAALSAPEILDHDATLIHMCEISLLTISLPAVACNDELETLKSAAYCVLNPRTGRSQIIFPSQDCVMLKTLCHLL
jgi:hypothetical protein